MTTWNDLSVKKPAHLQRCIVYCYKDFDIVLDRYIEPNLSIKTWIEISPTNGYWDGEAFNRRTPTFWTEIPKLPSLENATFLY